MRSGWTERLFKEGRLTMLNPRNMTAFAHLGFGAVCLTRPNLGELFKSYAPFGNIPAWGVGMMLLGFIILAANRASVMLMIGHLLSAICLWTVGGLLTAGAGLLPASTFAFGLGWTSVLLFARTFRQFLDCSEFYDDLRTEPPKWLEKRGWFRRLKERHEEEANGRP